MTAPIIWWIATGALVALELTTGTFYLLMLALGAAAGALGAHAGLDSSLQMVLAAVVGGVAVFASYLMRRRRPGDPSPRADRSVNLDVGGTLHIEHWDDRGEAQVRYRGAQWTAVYHGQPPAQPGAFRIVELMGSRLLVEPLTDPG